MAKILFIISISAEILTMITLVVSIAVPHRRIWPTRRRNSWEQYFMLLLFNISAVGVIILGIMDWGAGTISLGMRVVGFLAWPN